MRENIKIGTVLKGKYKILDEIGRGGSATIYLVRDISTKLTRCLALKAVRKNQENNLVEQYREEMNVLDHLSHQSITTIIDCFETETYLFIVMNYIAGNNLKEKRTIEGNQSEEDVVEWAIKLCDVLDYIHKNGYVYCDMNPKNVMLDENGSIHLLDFGICEKYTGEKSQSPEMGTKGFSAPEQYVSGSRILTPMTDVYGLGETIINLLTGKTIINIESNHEDNQKILNEMSKGMQTVVLKCTQKDPKDRYQNMQEIKKALMGLHELTEIRLKRIKRSIGIFGISLFSTMLLISGTIFAYRQEMDTNQTLYSQYVAQATASVQEGETEAALNYYLKAIEVKPHVSSTYDNLFNLLIPNANTLDYEEQAKSALDTLRYCSDVSDLSDATLEDALEYAILFSDPVYQTYSKDIIRELKSRKKSDELISIYEKFLNESEDASSLAVSYFENTRNNDAKRLDALFIALSSNSDYKVESSEVLKLEDGAEYSRILPLHTLLANKAYLRYQESGKKEDLKEAYEWIHSFDQIYSDESRILRAKIDVEYKDFSDAKSIYNEILSENPDDSGALIGLIQAVMAEQDSKGTSDYSEAMSAYERLNKSNTLTSEIISQMNAFKVKAGL